MNDTSTLMCIVFVASAVHRLFGFGFASIAIPLISLATSIEAGVLLLLLLSSTIAAQNLFSYKEYVDVRLAVRFIGISIIGVTIGYGIVEDISTRVATILAGSFILGITLLSYVTRSSQARAPLVPASLAAGLSNVLSAVNGPLIALFFSHVGFSKKQYIGTVSFVFLSINILAIVAQLIAEPKIGLSTNQLILIIGALFLGSFFGRKLFQKVSVDTYKSYLLIGIAALATVSIIQAAIS